MREVLALSIILLCILIDFSSKVFIMSLQSNFDINSYISIYLVYNTGIAFSLFDEIGASANRILSGFIFIILIILSFILIKSTKSSKKFFYGLTLIIGGGVSNFIDRYIDGSVVDFILIHYDNLYFPAIFNIADIFISIGTLFILLSFIYKDDEDYKI